MRVEAIDFDLANQMAPYLSYLELKGLNGSVFVSSMNKNHGARFLREGNYRGLDLYEVVKYLQLGRLDSRLMILRFLRRSDLIQLLFMLDKKALINGLRFFDKTKLVRLLMRLHKKWLLKMLKHLFSIDELVKKMPTAELFNILKSDKVPNRELVKAFNYMDKTSLIQLLGKIFGKDMSHLAHSEMMDILFKTDKRKIIDGMQSLPWKALIPMVTQLVKTNPDLLENMSEVFIFRLLSKTPKTDLLKACEMLPEDMIINQFLSQLPDKFLLLTAAQIDTKQLEGYLISSQPNLLAQLADVAA